MSTAHAVVTSSKRTWLLRALAAFFAGLAIVDLFVLDLGHPHGISQIWSHASLALFFAALQLAHHNRFRKPLFALASISLIGDAIYTFESE
jgi:hypothetical protein